jgi:hypothetical protein
MEEINNHIETDQTSGLSSEERNARIEELKKARNKLMFEKTRAKNAGLDTSEIMAKIHEIQDELHKLDLEKGLEEGYWVRTDDGTIISNGTIFGEENESAYRKQQKKRRIIIISVIVVIIAAIILIIR